MSFPAKPNFRPFKSNDYKLALSDTGTVIGKDNAIVAFMGATCTGKSTFIKMVTGQDVEVGHRLRSTTKDIRVFSCPHPDGSGRNLLMVDMPGFGNTSRTDLDVLQSIATWLATTYHNGVTLTAILFFHRITDNRLAGTSLDSLRIFRKLCGEESLRNVVLVTTMWDLVDPSIGERREHCLLNQAEFWKPMVKRGSQMARCYNTQESRYAILNLLHGKQPVVIQIQAELVKQKLPLLLTEAGAAIDSTLAKLASEHQEILRDLKDEYRRSVETRDEIFRRQVRQDQKRVEEVLKRTTEERRRHFKKLRKTKVAMNIAFPQPGNRMGTRSYKKVVEENGCEDRNYDGSNVIVAVMGATGTGKSTFIKMITGQDVEVGHDLTSTTEEIRVFSCSHPDGSGRNLLILDTPGCDDTVGTDTDILESIAIWLAATPRYDNKVTLAGILFFHRIIDNRLGWSSLKNLWMFRRLFGEESLRNVVLVTTMWDMIDPSIGERRENDLRNQDEFRKPMVQRGSQMARCYDNQESRYDILNLIHGKKPTQNQAPMHQRTAYPLAMAGNQKTLGDIAEEQDIGEEPGVEEHGTQGVRLAAMENQLFLEDVNSAQDAQVEESGSEDEDYQSSLVEGDLDAVSGDSEQLPVGSQVDYHYILSNSRHPARKKYFLPTISTISSSVESMYTASEEGSRYGMMFEF